MISLRMARISSAFFSAYFFQPLRFRRAIHILFEEIVARHAAVERHAQQLAFEAGEPPVQAVQLVNEGLDAAVVEPHLLHILDQINLQLGVALRLRIGELVGLVLHAGEPLLLQLA
jgi:hypothetical protein